MPQDLATPNENVFVWEEFCSYDFKHKLLSVDQFSNFFVLLCVQSISHSTEKLQKWFHM